MTVNSRDRKRGWYTLALWNTVWLACGLVLLEIVFGEWLFGDGMPFYVPRNLTVLYDCTRL